LEDHADTPPHRHRIDLFGVEILAVVGELALYTSTGDQIVGAVEAT
jgi:hypothetical protein